MSKITSSLRVLFLLFLLCLSNGCSRQESRLKGDVIDLLESLPKPPNSALLSETGKNTSGADPRCNGYLSTRLYGTNEPMASIVRFVMDEIAVQGRWSLDPRLPREEENIDLVDQNGYLLGVSRVELREELLKDPFFYHKVPLDQPYKTIFLFNIVHIDPLRTEYCWGF